MSADALHFHISRRSSVIPAILRWAAGTFIFARGPLGIYLIARANRGEKNVNTIVSVVALCLFSPEFRNKFRISLITRSFRGPPRNI